MSLARFFFGIGPFGRNVYTRSRSFFQVSTRSQYLRQLLAGYDNRILLSIHMEPIPDPPDFPPVLLVGIRKYVNPKFTFKAKTYTYLDAYWDDIYQELRIPETIRISTVSIAPGNRERMMQYFADCKPGTYGYYARKALRPIRFLVGNLASANIDLLFIAMAPFVNQPLRRDNEKLMNIAETKYWNTRKQLVDWLAGQLLGVRSRGWATQIAQKYSAAVKDSGLPEEQVFTKDQLAEVTTKFTEVFDKTIDELDPLVVAELADEYADKLISENRVKLGSDKPDSDI